MFTSRFQAWVRRRALGLAARLSRWPISPNHLTLAGMVITFAAATLAGFGQLRLAGVVLAFSGVFDILDGALARATNTLRPFGAFLDSTLDRYSEAAVYLGIAAYFLTRQGAHMRLEVMACLLALTGSLLVSYARARAESLGFASSGGLFARPERVVALVIALIIAIPWLLAAVVGLLALMTNFTVLQRMWIVWSQAQKTREAPPPEKASVAGAAPKSAGDLPRP